MKTRAMLRDFALTLLTGILIGLTQANHGITHLSWGETRDVLDAALTGALVPVLAALAPFYPAYGFGSSTARSEGVTPAPEKDYLKPEL